MFRPEMTKDQLIGIIRGMSEDDIARFLYCQEMAGTYMAVGQFEDILISAMQMCDRLKVHDRLGGDADRWERFLAKRELLRGSTLGSLIKILDKHRIAQSDIGYLRWIKDKRDHFVHRWFHGGAWPGDLDGEECRLASRRLLVIQMWLSRAERQIWFIFERAGLLTLARIEDGTLLAMNSGLDNIFGSGGWNDDVAPD